MGILGDHGPVEGVHPRVGRDHQQLPERGLVRGHHLGGAVPPGHGFGHEFQAGEVLELVAPMPRGPPHRDRKAVAALPHPDHVRRQAGLLADLADAQQPGLLQHGVRSEKGEDLPGVQQAGLCHGGGPLKILSSEKTKGFPARWLAH